MERSNLLAVQRLQVFNDLTVACIVNVHIRYEDHTWKLILLTQIPRPLRTGLNAGFTGYNNDCRIRCGYSLLHFSHEIKISRCI